MGKRKFFLGLKRVIKSDSKKRAKKFVTSEKKMNENSYLRPTIDNYPADFLTLSANIEPGDQL